MAIYVMSDIHGNYEKYIQAFKAIDLKDTDTLYVLGDVVDRSTGSCKILLDMMCHFNIIPLLGNHEFMATTVLSKLVEEITEESLISFGQDFITGMLHWFENGGDVTLKEFKQLSLDDRQAVLEYLEEFELYAEITVNNQDYVLVHAGLGNFKKTKRLSDYKLNELIWAETDYDKVYFKDKILITGHIPVSAILFDKSADKILKQNNHIAIDCGCGFNRNLAVLCLDTMEEMYF
ncbi:MAG: metallophosphoesterase [Evtepia sp.]